MSFLHNTKLCFKFQKFSKIYFLFKIRALSLKEDDTVCRNIAYSAKSMNLFDTIIYLIGQIHSLLVTNSTCTKRELYYRNVEMFSDQTCVNTALNHISALLETPLWELGVMSTSKGIVAGDLTVIYEESRIQYTQEKGDTVPSDLSGIIGIESKADFVLIVEKDTVFKRLFDDGIFKFLNVILITVSSFHGFIF